MLTLNEQIDLLFNNIQGDIIQPKIYQFQTIANNERYKNISKHRIRIRTRCSDIKMDVNDYLTIEFDWVNINNLYTIFNMLNDIGVISELDIENREIKILTVLKSSDLLDIVHLESMNLNGPFNAHKYDESNDKLITSISDINDRANKIKRSILFDDSEINYSNNVVSEYIPYYKYSSYLKYNKLMDKMGLRNKLIQKMQIIFNQHRNNMILPTDKYTIITSGDILETLYSILKEYGYNVVLDNNKLTINNRVPCIFLSLLHICIRNHNERYFHFMTTGEYLEYFKEEVGLYLVYANVKEVNINEFRIRYKTDELKDIPYREIIYKNTFENYIEYIKYILLKCNVFYYTHGGVITILGKISKNTEKTLERLNLSEYGVGYLLNNQLEYILSEPIKRRLGLNV